MGCLDENNLLNTETRLPGVAQPGRGPSMVDGHEKGHAIGDHEGMA